MRNAMKTNINKIMEILYKGFRIFKEENYYNISYMHSRKIWKTNIKSLSACKQIISCAWNRLRKINNK